ncbi:MAG: flagellar basal body P-ring protein FlgI [Sandaracinus sp.]|nr:flagellar basal body P-ring protein FlgI [Sandaracinus sp.]MCB9632476.1 flagellar basal body P-ring protein FlgI [Sandaracinus sp.]
MSITIRSRASRSCSVRRRPLVVGATVATIVSLFAATPASATRVQDLCEIRGVRENQLVGYGLVVGLDGTGDSGQARFTVQSTAAMLRRLGATLDPSAIQTKNAAAVMVTATLPPHSNPGAHVDLTVSSLGNARSLLGGTLLQTPLYGADGTVYVVGQGPVLVGGFAAGGGTGSSVQRNHVTVGRVPGGGIVERPAPRVALGRRVELSLRRPSFVTAQRVVEAINTHFGEPSARALDGGTVRIEVPERLADDVVAAIAEVQQLDVIADVPARVVIDERTGTVVLGADVRIREVAIAQGGLSITIDESFAVSQPDALAGGDTAVVPRTEVRATENRGSLQTVPATASLADVVTALNALGASPRDLVAIFQALHTAGALEAEIEVQ